MLEAEEKRARVFNVLPQDLATEKSKALNADIGWVSNVLTALTRALSKLDLRSCEEGSTSTRCSSLDSNRFRLMDAVSG